MKAIKSILVVPLCIVFCVSLNSTAENKKLRAQQNKQGTALQEKREWIVNQKPTSYKKNDQWIWEIKSIKKLPDDSIEVNFLFTNDGSYGLDIQLTPNSNNNYISDNNGKRYLYTSSFGISEKNAVRVFPGSPYAAKIIYPKLDENVESISLILDIGLNAPAIFPNIRLK